MVVALRTTDGKTKERRGDDLDRLGDAVILRELLIGGAVAGAVGAHAQKAGGDQLVEFGGGSASYGGFTSSSPANCSTMNSFHGLSVLNDRMT